MKLFWQKIKQNILDRILHFLGRWTHPMCQYFWPVLCGWNCSKRGKKSKQTSKNELKTWWRWHNNEPSTILLSNHIFNVFSQASKHQTVRIDNCFLCDGKSHIYVDHVCLSVSPSSTFWVFEKSKNFEKLKIFEKLEKKCIAISRNLFWKFAKKLITDRPT